MAENTGLDRPPEIYRALLAHLDAADVPYRIHKHPPIRTVDDAQRLWPGVLNCLVKTVAFGQRDGGIILAAARARARIRYAALAAAVGIRRRDLHPLPAGEVETLLGVPPGGVFPLPLRGIVDHVIFDEGIAALEQVYCGSGRLDRTLEFRSADLIALGGGIRAWIASLPD